MNKKMMPTQKKYLCHRVNFINLQIETLNVNN